MTAMIENGKTGKALKPPDALAVEHLRRYFINREDKVYFWEGSYPSPCEPDDIGAALLAHVAGPPVPPSRLTYKVKDKIKRRVAHPRLGTLSPFPGPEGLTRFGCVDCDGGGEHSASLADPFRAALRILARLEEVGLIGVLERSGSGKGWHVWVLFDGMVPAALVRQVLFACCPVDEPLASGSMADARANIGLECFPKQDKIPENGTGNQVWLPYWYGAKDGGNLLYHVNENGEPVAEAMDILPTHTLTELEEASIAVGVREPKQATPSAPSTTWEKRVPDSTRVSAGILIDRALQRVQPGHPQGRNDTGSWLAQQLRDNRYSEAEAAPIMRQYAARFSGETPAYRESEAVATVRSIYTRPPREPWTRVAERRGYAPVSPPAAEAKPDPYLTASEFAAGDYKPSWLIRRLLVAQQPGVLGGPRKSLKTNIFVDLHLSFGSGSPFLGEFEMYRPVRSLLVSCESGEHTIQETCKRVCAAKGIKLEDTDCLFWFSPYQLADAFDLDRLARSIQHHKPEVVILEPLYLQLLGSEAAAGLEAGNMFDVGPLLLKAARVCLDNGATPILGHHARKQLAHPGEPLELEDLSHSGTQEFARQWLLLSRRCPYEPGSGKHHLWLSAGGSCGQGGLWGLDIDEGVLREDFTGRRWEVKVIKPGGQQTGKQERTVKEHGTRILNALDQLMKEGQTSPLAAGEGVAVGCRQVRVDSGLSGDNFDRAINALCRDGIIERVAVLRKQGKKGQQEAEGIKRAPVSGVSGTVGQQGDSPTVPL